jgi:hypothetical protein
MRIVAAIAGAVLLFACPALAETAAPPTPAALAHAQHLMDVMHMDKMMDQMSAAMMKPMMAKMYEKLPTKQREKAAAFQDAMWEEMSGLTPKLTTAMVRIYAANLTEQELADMDQFYSSASGQSVLAKLPQLTQQLVPVMMGEMPALMGRVFDRYCSKVTCTKEERAGFAKSIEMMGPKPGA